MHLVPDLNYEGGISYNNIPLQIEVGPTILHPKKKKKKTHFWKQIFKEKKIKSTSKILITWKAKNPFVCTYLLGLLHEKNPAGPRIQIEPDQPVYIFQKMVSNNGRVSKAHG